MSDEFDHTRIKTEAQKLARRAPAQFDEAPGEAEADAARKAFLTNAGAEQAGAASALANADSATRAQVVNRLQEERGNAYVQRVVAESHGTPGRLVGLSQSAMVSEVLQRKDAGSSLPEDTQAQMEGHFGADLSGVQVHTGGEANSLNRELNAQAFTVGSDIFFAEGKYDPSSTEGKGLLAHELTHVGQQTGFAGRGVQREAAPEEEEEQVQRQAAPEEEEGQVQRQASPEEEEEQVQREAAPEEDEQVQRQAAPEEEEEAAE